MRRAAKTDRNHSEIVKAFRQFGAGVLDLSAVGHGCPDTAVGFRGNTYFFEIKDGLLSPSRRVLTADQQKFFDSWPGHAEVVQSVEQAIERMAELGVR